MAGILVLNAGSSSVKFVHFDEALAVRHRGIAADLGGGSARLSIDGEESRPALRDHVEALAAIFGSLARRGVAPADLAAAGHRIVHGGPALRAPCRVTPEVIAAIEACIPLAPLHNPHNLAAIQALAAIAPDLPQFASFDTAFHAGNPEVARRYALPAAETARGLRRYGFHGLSFTWIVRRLPALSGSPLPRRLLALHLGNGASLCAIRDGASVATTMGYSPLDGLTMGTRCGAIDGNVVLRLVELHGLERTRRMLNQESGLVGLAGVSDMKRLVGLGTPEARFAIDHFCYWAARHAGSMAVAMEGVDAVVFSGGIGENDAGVRQGIADRLAWLGLALDPAANHANRPRLHAEGSRVGIWIVPTEEERVIAEDALALLRAEGDPPLPATARPPVTSEEFPR